MNTEYWRNWKCHITIPREPAPIWWKVVEAREPKDSSCTKGPTDGTTWKWLVVEGNSTESAELRVDDSKRGNYKDCCVLKQTRRNTLTQTTGSPIVTKTKTNKKKQKEKAWMQRRIDFKFIYSPTTNKNSIPFLSKSHKYNTDYTESIVHRDS